METVERNHATTMSDATQVPRFRDAYQRLLDEIRNVPAGELATINIDIPSAVTTVLGSLPEIRALRAQLLEEVPKFDITRLDQLESYTLAVAHAHALWISTSTPKEALPALSEAGSLLRDTLLSDVQALVRRGLVDGQRIKDVKMVNGYRALAFDLCALAAVLREGWLRIQGKTAITANELDEAETLADKLLTALGEREQGPNMNALSAQTRQRAFTLFLRAYEQVRRAVIYVRWDERDAEQIAPSLYAGRNNGRRKQDDVTSPSSDVTKLETQPITPVPAAASTEPPVPVGMPNSNPFLNA